MPLSATRLRSYLFTLTTFLLVTQLAAVSAQAQGQSRTTTITNCGTVINTAGTYILVNDLNCPADGIDVNVSSVVLKLGGHTITGTSSSASGINVSLIFAGEVQVLGPGTIQGFGVGVNITDNFGGVVHVTGVTSTGASSLGFDARNAKVILRGNTASGSQEGFYLLLADNSELSGNMASGNSDNGFLIGGSHDQIMHNTALNNGGNGIATVSGSVHNEINNNSAMGNTGFDLFEANGTCLNIWASNTFHTANKPCIH